MGTKCRLIGEPLPNLQLPSPVPPLASAQMPEPLLFAVEFPSLAMHFLAHSTERLMNGAGAVTLFGFQISAPYKPVDGFYRGSWTHEWDYVAHKRSSNKNGRAHSEEECRGAKTTRLSGPRDSGPPNPGYATAAQGSIYPKI